MRAAEEEKKRAADEKAAEQLRAADELRAAEEEKKKRAAETKAAKEKKDAEDKKAAEAKKVVDEKMAADNAAREAWKKTPGGMKGYAMPPPFSNCGLRGEELAAKTQSSLSFPLFSCIFNVFGRVGDNLLGREIRSNLGVRTCLIQWIS